MGKPGTLPSPRELDTLAATVTTDTSCDAAAKLGVHPHTVKNHNASVRRRLRVATTVQAVYVATVEGLIPPDLDVPRS